MSLFSCNHWVLLIWERLCGVSNQNQDVVCRTADLPYEIIAYILVKLPAEKVFLSVRVCRPLLDLTRAILFRQATPIIVYQYFSRDLVHIREGDEKTALKSVQEIEVHFTDGANKPIESKKIKFDLARAGFKKQNYHVPYIYGSYNGFLLFRNIRYDSILFIWNPVTQEQVKVIAPDDGYRARGFYFHNTTNEYRVIFVFFKGERLLFQYFILSLKTKLSRRIKDCSFVPSDLPVILNDVLYWRADGFEPPYTDCILLFNVNSEDFSTMSHPGDLCSLSRDPSSMKLTAREGLLCLCHASSKGKIFIWVLEDIVNQVWAQIHVVEIPFILLGVVRTLHWVDAVDYFNDEILLNMWGRRLCLYNLRESSYNDIGRGCPDGKLHVSSACHINTFASLYTDRKVYLFPERASRLS